MKPPTRKLAIVEDESELRRTLAEILADAPGWVITGSFPNAEVALPALLATPPEVVLMDIQLPGMSGIECTAALKAAHPEVQVLMITVYDNSDREIGRRYRKRPVGPGGRRPAKHGGPQRHRI